MIGGEALGEAQLHFQCEATIRGLEAENARLREAAAHVSLAVEFREGRTGSWHWYMRPGLKDALAELRALLEQP